MAALRVEHELLDAMAAAATHMMAVALIAVHSDRDFVASCKEGAKESESRSGETVTRREKNRCLVNVRFASGMLLTIATCYFIRVTKRRRRKRAKSGTPVST